MNMLYFYMVIGSFSFLIKYLELSLFRFLCGNLTLKQEPNIRLTHNPCNPDGVMQKILPVAPNIRARRVCVPKPDTYLGREFFR